MTALGTLYGVGVGPGAPDLLTLRALRVWESADVLALPRSNDWGASKAWEARHALNLAACSALRSARRIVQLCRPVSSDGRMSKAHAS